MNPEQIAELALWRMLARLHREGLSHTITAMVELPDLSARLTVGPINATDTPETPLTPCQRDCLTVVRECGPLTTRAVLAELERRRWDHGESTCKLSLAHLVRAGLIGNRGDHRGYFVE